jgi:hypothetical protein
MQILDLQEPENSADELDDSVPCDGAREGSYKADNEEHSTTDSLHFQVKRQDDRVLLEQQ